MIKQAPSPLRLAAMAIFTLSCFGLLLFLWISFGGPLPLRPEAYRFEVTMGEAATLAQEADVRLAGVNVGKVKTKELDKGGARTIVEIELDSQYAPIPRDTRATLRQKTLLGETYVELSPGDGGGGDLGDGERLPAAQVEPTVELDEIFSAFDKPTRDAFQSWVAELAKASRGKAGQDLNDALGNLEGFAVDGAELLEELDEQELALRGVVKNTGRVFGAINEREGALGELIVNSGNTFEATASRDEELAQTFEVFPTFLDESKATLARLERFAGDARPLVNDLKAPADDLGPTLRDLSDLAPDLQALFRDLPPLIRASEDGLPALEGVLRGAEPVLEALHPFFQELNPILSFFNYHQVTIASFLSNAGSDLNSKPGGERAQAQVAIIDPRSFEKHFTRPDWERGNSYLAPNAYVRGWALGIVESFDCNAAGGEKRDPVDAENVPGPPKGGAKRLPCFVQPPSLYNGKRFAKPERGSAPLVDPPKGSEGTEAAIP
jgi:virulence factor Mce-like protein